MTISKERLGMLFILVGPGGAGKNTLMNIVLDKLGNLRQLPTATTRPIRPNEKEGREHNFYTIEAFRQLIANDALVEYQEVRPGAFYGVPRATVQNAIDACNDLIADIDVLGAAVLREEFLDHTTAIFIAPPSMDRLETQMRERGTSETVIRDRMARAIMEMPHAPLCNHIIFNDDLDTAADELYAIINHERENQPLNNVHSVEFAVRVVPYYGDERLVPKGDDLTTHFTTGTTPQSAAESLLNTTFGLDPTTVTWQQLHDTLNPTPISITTQDNHYRLQFHYVAALPERITPPAGWHWQPINTDEGK